MSGHEGSNSLGGPLTTAPQQWPEDADALLKAAEQTPETAGRHAVKGALCSWGTLLMATRAAGPAVSPETVAPCEPDHWQRAAAEEHSVAQASASWQAFLGWGR
eukprot:8157257-Alexandrium_andersonii.AAC.1